MKILVILGTRPEAIKMSSLIDLIQRDPKLKLRVCVTAQHRKMLDQVLDLFKIKPFYDLDIMKKGQTLNSLASEIFSKIDSVIKDYNPDIVLVHGDTATTVYSALASFNQKKIIGHVEAGLRTFDLKFPWPEEANRQLVSKISDFHFAPTKEASKNLIKEGVQKNKIFITGNTVIDALLRTKEKIKRDKKLVSKLRKEFNFLDENKKLILVTGHRRENFGEGLMNICEAIKVISSREVQVIYSVHLNPNVKKTVSKILKNVDDVHLLQPLDYFKFVYLMEKSHFILTDSGGIQEEAPSLNKPVLVMRDKTERPEALKTGAIKLVGTSKKKIIQESFSLLDDEKKYNAMAYEENPYGDGKSSKRILKIIKDLK